MRLLITGASGQVGTYLVREARRQGVEVIAWSGTSSGSFDGVALQPVDLAQRDDVVTAFRSIRPRAVIHAAAIASIAQCWAEPQRAHEVNVEGSALLADLSAECQARFIYLSTDLVFNGQAGGYREEDQPDPLSIYGKTKSQAEGLVLEYDQAIVVRASLLIGPSLIGRPYFFDGLLHALQSGTPITLFDDEWRTPLSLKTLARALLALIRSDFRGMLHMGGPERLSRWEMGVRLANVLSLDSSPLIAADRSSLPSPEVRPQDTSLDSSRWRSLFPFHEWPAFESSLREMGLGR